VEITGRIELTGVTVAEVTAAVIEALIQILADLLGVPAEAITITVVLDSAGRRLLDRGTIIKYDIVLSPEDANMAFAIVRDTDFVDDFEIEVNTVTSGDEDLSAFQTAFAGAVVEEPQLTTLSPTPAPGLGNDDEGEEAGIFDNLAVIAGIAVAGTAVLVAFVFIVVRRRGSDNQNSSQDGFEMGAHRLRKKHSDLVETSNPMDNLSGNNMGNPTRFVDAI